MGDQYDQLQKNPIAHFEEVKEDREQLKKTITNLMSGFEDPVQGLNTSQIEEVNDKHIHDFSSDKHIENNVSIDVPKEEDLKEPVEPLKKSEVSQDEQDRINYMTQLEKEKDLAMIENLKYMMETGFTNYQINKSLLQRNNNDLAVALNLLCNGIVSDSMFLQQ